jgi:hypothetical protein
LVIFSTCIANVHVESSIGQRAGLHGEDYIFSWYSTY